MASNGGGNTKCISKAMLKRTSGEFDLESIFTLNLSDMGIEDLGCIGLCTTLESLNLSRNNCSQLLPLSGLSCLTHLDLSSNRISNIEGLQTLSNLCSLNIAGNLISSCDVLRILRDLEKFTELRMKDNIRGLTNPACHSVQYKSRVLSFLPDLSVLDGERLAGKGSDLFKIFEEMDRSIEDIKLATSGINSVSARPEPWFSQEILNFNQESTKTKQIESDSAGKKFAGLLSDCNQLLRAFDAKMTDANQELLQATIRS